MNASLDLDGLTHLPLVPHICGQWIWSAMVQIMAWRRIGYEPLAEPMLEYCQLDSCEQTSVKLESKYNFFIHEKRSENIVCEMAAILSRGDDLLFNISIDSYIPMVNIVFHWNQNKKTAVLQMTFFIQISMFVSYLSFGNTLAVI